MKKIVSKKKGLKLKAKELNDVAEKISEASKYAAEDYARFSRHRTIGEKLSYCATMESICRSYKDNIAREEDPKGRFINQLYDYILNSVKTNLEEGTKE